ncbi:MAG: DnaJ domain-containing protein [Chloroflexota bacterium]
MGLPFFSRTRTSQKSAATSSGAGRSQAAPRSERPDLYSILGVPPHASQEAIRAAYRKQAAPLVDRWWLPGRAERQLARLNSAYEILSHASRRSEYDAQQGLGLRLIEPLNVRQAEMGHLEPFGPGRPGLHGRRTRARGTGLLDAVVIVFVVALALGTASVIVSMFSPSLSGVLDLTENWGLTPRRRTSATDTRPKPQASPEIALASQATAQPSPTTAPPAGVERYAGTELEISDPNPPRRTDLTVTLRLVRDGQPVEGALAYLIARYRTTEERWPQGTATVRTDSSGLARVSFNIGDATAGFPVPVEMVTLIDGQQFSWRSQFIPR